MTGKKQVTAIAATLLVLSLAAAAALVHRLDRIRAHATLQEVLYIPSPKVVKRLSLGYTGLMADIYWTRAVQYFGRKHHASAGEYHLLAPLLDITTQLDPHLIPAYKFGGIFLAQQPPEGAGQPDKAVELVERGIRENPINWELYYHLGFIHYFERDDWEAAAQAFERGTQVPGAHPWLRVMAASLRQHGGDVRTARFLWTKIYETTYDKNLKANALRRLQSLDVDESVRLLEEAVQLFRQRAGRPPQSWVDMVSAGILRSVPLDPLGYSYKLTPDGRVEVRDPKEFPFITRGLPPGAKPYRVYAPRRAEARPDASK